ncbi:MAG TPA: hypothetical protein VGS57_15760 [Thermoanaerobaculia bacterium]|jgi:hypothetical protein|nr:hypothetical protein [Thermoanaerobaculia bacterium]
MGNTPLPRSVAAALLAAAALASAPPARAIDQGKPARPGRTWYVDNTAAPDGDGSMVAPFDRLARAERAADAGDTLYVFRGDGTSRGLDAGIRLRPFQRLIGSGARFEAEGETPLPAGDRPLLAAAGGPVLVLADGVRVEGLAIAGGGDAIAGDGLADVHLAGVHVDGGLRLRDPRGLVHVESTDLRAGGGPALAVESARGEARLELDGVTLLGGGATDDGLAVRAGGDASLTVAAESTVLDGVAGNGVALAAAGRSRLRLELAGSGLVGDLPAGTSAALAAVVRDDATLEIAARGNDLPARETAVLLAANGRGHLRAELDDNVVGGAGSARGVVLLLGDAGDAALTLTGNRIAGQRAEALYAVAGAQTALGIAARDNDLAAGAAAGSASYPALLVESNGTARACVTLAENRFAETGGGAPAVTLRQRDTGILAVGGYTPASAGDLTQRLAATNRLSRAAVEADRPLGDPTSTPCIDLPPPRPAMAVAAPPP